MKKSTQCVLFLVLSMNLSYGQGLYFKLGGGYALPLASEVMGTKETRTQNVSTNTNSTENVSGSFGAGMNINLSGGYLFNKNIGFDLGVIYQRSKKYETGSKYYDIGFGKEEDIITQQSTAIFINPSLFITSGAGNKVPYGKFGVIVGSPKINNVENYYYDLDGVDISHREWEYKKGMAFGFQGTVGMNWMLSNKLDLFTEINFVSMSFYPGEYELKTYTSNGADVLSFQSPYYKKTEFVKQLDPNAPFDPNKPMQALRVAKSFGSLSFNVGVRYLLKGHEQ